MDPTPVIHAEGKTTAEVNQKPTPKEGGHPAKFSINVAVHGAKRGSKVADKPANHSDMPIHPWDGSDEARQTNRLVTASGSDPHHGSKHLVIAAQGIATHPPSHSRLSG
jgi:hypothetical protein